VIVMWKANLVIATRAFMATSVKRNSARKDVADVARATKMVFVNVKKVSAENFVKEELAQTTAMVVGIALTERVSVAQDGKVLGVPQEHVKTTVMRWVCAKQESVPVSMDIPTKIAVRHLALDGQVGSNAVDMESVKNKFARALEDTKIHLTNQCGRVKIVLH
jgi:hypothetical protein